MRSCDTCPGDLKCAADNLAPVLAEIYTLYAGGTTDKFEILFALSDEFEELFERYNDQVSRICWTKAALEVIAEILSACDGLDQNKDGIRDHVHATLTTAVCAFANFPWYVSGLIGQAPELYEAIAYKDEKNQFVIWLSKREFVKMCKTVVYNE